MHEQVTFFSYVNIEKALFFVRHVRTYTICQSLRNNQKIIVCCHFIKIMKGPGTSFHSSQ